MSWWLKKFGLILIICHLAACSPIAEEESSRLLSGQDTKVFLNPLSLFYDKYTTAKPAKPGKVIVIRPQNYYPSQYPYPPTKRPRPSKKPTKRPVARPLCPPNYSYYTWFNSARNYGYIQNPVGICIPNNIGNNNNCNNNNGNGNNGNNNNGNGNNGNRPNNNSTVIPNNNGNNVPNGNGTPNNTLNNTNNATVRNGILLRGPINPYGNNEYSIATSDDSQAESLGEYDDNDYEIAANGRSAAYNDASSEDNDNDELPVNTKDVKLPFHVQLNSPAISVPLNLNKKFKDQETLVYLRNLKNGRKLDTDKLI